MNADFRRKLVRRLDILFFIGLLTTSGLAAILFATEFYEGEEAEEVAAVPSATPTHTATYTATRLPTLTTTATPTATPTATTIVTATATREPSATPDLGATADALAAQRLTATARGWTATPSPRAPTMTREPSATPDLGATADVLAVQRLTATARGWTPTPGITATREPATPTPGITREPSATPDLDATADVLAAQRLTATARGWTATPSPRAPTATRRPSATPDIEGTVEALAAQRLTATARGWTATPSPRAPTMTREPSATPDLGATADVLAAQRLTAAAPAPTSTPWPAPFVAPLSLAETYAGQPFVVSGTAQPGDEIALYDGDTLLATTTAGDSGAWTIELPEGLSAGEHNLGIVATGPGGSVSPRVPAGFQVQGAPTATATPRPSATPTATPTTSPTPSPTPATPTRVALAPTSTARPTTPAPTATLTETPTATVTLTPSAAPPVIDPLPPEVSVLEPVELAGRAVPGQTIRVAADGVPVDEVTAGDDGAWRMTWTPDRTGPVTLSAIAGTPGGASGPPAITTTRLVAPRPRIDAPAPGEVYSPGSIPVRGLAAPGVTVDVQLSASGASLGTAQASEQGVWQAAITLDDTGQFTLRASSGGPDGAPRVSDPVTITIAPPVQPDTGANLLLDPDDKGRAYTALVALLLASGGFSTYFAGRLIYTLARDRLR